MYNVEELSAVLENAPGFARLDLYLYGPLTKWQHWGMFNDNVAAGSVRLRRFLDDSSGLNDSEQNPRDPSANQHGK